MKLFWKLTRYARAARFWLLVLAAVLAWCGIGRAQAQDYSGCYNLADHGSDGAPYTPICPDRQTAYEQAELACEAYSGQACFFNAAQSNGVRFRTAGNGYTTWRYWGTPECPNGKPWNDATYTCGSPCDDAPDLGPMKVIGSSTACSGGCQYRQDDEGGVNVCLGEGATMYCGAKRWTATGDECQAGDQPPQSDFDPNKATCATVPGGTFNECVKPNGDHCITSSRGTSLCWSPNETGPRVTADGKEGADRQLAPNTPTQPQAMSDVVPTGSSTTSINGTTYNTSTFTGSGSTGGQGNTGSGGKDGGLGDGDGDGEDDEGEGQSTGEGPGDLYTPGDKTVASIYASYKARVEASPLISALTGVFGGCVGAGACPAETWSPGYFDFTGDLSSFCGSALQSVIDYAGWIALFVMAWAAVRIGIL